MCASTLIKSYLIPVSVDWLFRAVFPRKYS